MRKQTKLVAVLLAMGVSMTSFAKAGWALDGDKWVWLDEDGLIAQNTIIEDDEEIYYVNEYGIRVKNV